MLFANRAVAGRLLAHRLTHYANRRDVVVLGLPRGGVAVAYEIAAELDTPLDVLVVRKIGLPGHEELAIGAIGPGGVVVVNEDLCEKLGIAQAMVDSLAEREREELDRRTISYRGARPSLALEERIAIIADDGLATGATMAAAIRAARLMQPRRIIAAVPVGAVDAVHGITKEADEIVCLATPEPFQAVSIWYDRFEQTSDERVCELIRESAERTEREMIR